MAEQELRFGFRRQGWTSNLFFLFFVPFVGVGVFLLLTARQKARDVDAVRSYVPVAQANGPGQKVRVAGLAHRATPVTSPSGKTGVAWVGAVGWMQSHKNSASTFETICVRADFSELKLGEGLASGVTLAHPDDAVELGPAIRGRGLIVDVGHQRMGIPPAMSARCARELGSAPRNEKLYYEEGVVADGDALEVLACTTGNAVAPCGAGQDIVTRRGIDADIADAQGDGRSTGLIAAIWNLFVIGIVYLVVASGRVRGSATS